MTDSSAPGSHGHHPAVSLRQTAFSATVHCLTGCAIGEVLGMVIGTAMEVMRWSIEGSKQ